MMPADRTVQESDKRILNPQETAQSEILQACLYQANSLLKTNLIHLWITH